MANWTYDAKRKAWRKELWVNGQRTKLTFKGTKREAEAYEARRRVELGQPGAVVSQAGAPTFEAFCVEAYKPHAKATLRASTWNVRRYQLEPLIMHFGNMKLTKITTASVEAYKQHRVAGVEKSTVNDELKVLSVVLAYARHLPVPCASPKIKKYTVRARKGTMRSYSREDVQYILMGAAEVGPDFACLVRFLAETGCRRSEGLNLPWSRVDLTAGMAKIWSDVDDGEDYEVKSRDREVTLTDGLVRDLKDQKLRTGASPWVFPVRTDRASRGGLAHTKGERYAAWPKHTWARALRLGTQLRREPLIRQLVDAGRTRGEAELIAQERIPTLSGGPHRLRHTYASLFLAERPDLFALARVLGHSHTRVTELYSHLLPDHLAATRNVVTFGATPPKPHPNERI